MLNFMFDQTRMCFHSIITQPVDDQTWFCGLFTGADVTTEKDPEWVHHFHFHFHSHCSAILWVSCLALFNDALYSLSLIDTPILEHCILHCFSFGFLEHQSVRRTASKKRQQLNSSYFILFKVQDLRLNCFLNSVYLSLIQWELHQHLIQDEKITHSLHYIIKNKIIK